MKFICFHFASSWKCWIIYAASRESHTSLLFVSVNQRKSLAEISKARMGIRRFRSPDIGASRPVTDKLKLNHKGCLRIWLLRLQEEARGIDTDCEIQGITWQLLVKGKKKLMTGKAALRLFDKKLPVYFLKTIRTNAVWKFCFWMFADIRLDLCPIPFVIPNFLAGGTDGQ